MKSLFSNNTRVSLLLKKSSECLSPMFPASCRPTAGTRIAALMSTTSWAQIAATKNEKSPVIRNAIHAQSTSIPADPVFVKQNEHSTKPTSQTHSKWQGAANTYMSHRGQSDRSPLIISLRLDTKLMDQLTAIRKDNFPPRQNNLDAHLTILHALPASSRKKMDEFLGTLTKDCRPFQLRPGRLQVKPQIVLLPLRSKLLDDLVYQIQDVCWADLSDQDRQDFRGGHITLCNKLSEEETANRATSIDESLKHIDLSKCRAIGLDMWRYRGNKPWQPLSNYDFAK